MADQIVRHIARTLYEDGTLSRPEAFALSIVEHMIGSSLYYVPPVSGPYTDALLVILRAERFLICGTLFQNLEAAGLVVRTAIFEDDLLHETLNIVKEHCSAEWRV